MKSPRGKEFCNVQLQYCTVCYRPAWSLVIASHLGSSQICRVTDLVSYIVGYAAIKPVLIREGVYSELCSKDELENGTSPCYGQEIRSEEDFHRCI
jgi:hypothetical protein